MCFIGYVYFACGHKRILTQDCDIALTADTPSFIRHECPNYSQTSASPTFACGAGRFYCCETKDGSFLEHLHDSVSSAQREIARVDSMLTAAIQSIQRLNDEADRRHIPMAMRQQIPEFPLMAARSRDLLQQRGLFQQAQIESQAIIEQAREYDARLHQHVSNGGTGAYPPFVPSTNLFGKIPAEEAVTDASHTAANSEDISTMQKRPSMTQSNHQLSPSPPGSNIQVSGRPALNSHHPAGLSTRQPPHFSNVPREACARMQAQHSEAARQHQRAQEIQPPSLTRKPARPRGGRAPRAQMRAPDDQESVQDDRDSVRRSVRVRNKKVNYAESAGSSREPSPDKSDASGFSPHKSDDSASPSKSAKSRKQVNTDQQRGRQPQRSASSLSETLNDWTRRRNFAGAAPPVQPMQRRAMPGMQDLLNSSPAQAAQISNATTSPPVPAVRTPRLNGLPPVRSTTDPASLRYLIPNLTSANNVQHQQAPLGPSMQRPGTMGQPGQVPTSFGSIAPANSHPSAPPATRGWLVHGQGVQSFTRPQFTPLQLLPPQALGPLIQRPMPAPGSQSFNAPGTQFSFRKDSVTSHLGSPVNLMKHSATPPNYANMRRSFGTATTLTPPVPPSDTRETNEPRKRSRAPSGASTDNGKRPRLSLPSEETTSPTDWLLGQSVDLSSTSKIANDLAQELPGLPDEADLPTMPASKLTPTAVMSVPKHGGGAEVSPESGAPDDHKQRVDQDAEAESEQHGFEFSDNIDWGLPFEDTASGLL